MFMAFAAFAIDGAHLYVEKKHMQNAADAAALAAARQLPFTGWCTGNYQTPPSCAYNVSQAAMQYSNYNGGPDIPFPPCSGPSDTDCYVFQGGANVTGVQVRITETPTTWLLGALGVSGPVHVSAFAAASDTALTSTTTYPGTTIPSSTSTSTTVITTTVGGANGALFASDTSCSAISISK